MSPGSIISGQSVTSKGHEHVVIYMQEGDLLKALSKYKKHGIHEIENLVQEVSGMQHPFYLFSFMSLGKALNAA